MSLQEKVTYVKQLINLVCEVIPVIVKLIKEIIVTVQKIQTN